MSSTLVLEVFSAFRAAPMMETFLVLRASGTLLSGDTDTLMLAWSMTAVSSFSSLSMVAVEASEEVSASSFSISAAILSAPADWMFLMADSAAAGVVTEPGLGMPSEGTLGVLGAEVTVMVSRPSPVTAVEVTMTLWVPSGMATCFVKEQETLESPMASVVKVKSWELGMSLLSTITWNAVAWARVALSFQVTLRVVPSYWAETLVMVTAGADFLGQLAL